MQKELEVTAGDLTHTGGVIFGWGFVMVVFAGLKIFFLGIGIWSAVIVIVGLYFMAAGKRYSAPGYEAQEKIVKQYYQGK